jgi:hypothetical protein
MIDLLNFRLVTTEPADHHIEPLPIHVGHTRLSLFTTISIACPILSHEISV